MYAIGEVTTKPVINNRGTVARSLQANFSTALSANPAGGTVDLSVVVDVHGVPRQVTVVRSANAGFNAPAMNVVRAMRFTPATVNGAPVAVRLELPIRFTPGG